MVTISKEDINKQNVTLYVPEDKDKFKDFVLLNDRVSGEEYILSDDGAIINEKLAKLLGVVKGDEITFKDSENNSYIIKVSNISESYLSH